MKAEFANPFIRAAVEVFQSETGIKLTRTDLKVKPAPVPTLPISIIIGVTGVVKGQICYSMSETCAYEVAHAMLPDKLPVEIKRFTNSAVSEMANMITGKASIELAGEDFIVHITPPAVFYGTGIYVDFLNVPTIAVSFISEIGVLEINIALTDGGIA
jgi:chemotaxis protein CheX